MTRQRQLKSLIRSRMEHTGESYMVARRHVLNARPGSEYELRGGLEPEVTSIANAFANRGITDPFTGEPISEALVLGVGGGLGAGYILWEFGHSKGGPRRVVTLGFRNQWQYPDRWMVKVCERLGIEVAVHETTGSAKAMRQLDEALEAGIPAVAFVSTADLPHWHLPTEQSGWWGHPIVVYGKEGDRYLIDDRNRARLTIGAEELAAARVRIPSYKNRLVVADPAAIELEADRLAAAMRVGLEEQVVHLSEKSTSFSIPAFEKWAKMLTDTRNAKSWPNVFADGDVVGALASVVEQIDDRGMFGGTLRRQYADFLGHAGRVLEIDLGKAARAYEVAADRWLDVAVVCRSMPAIEEAARLSLKRREAVAGGDAGNRAAREASKALAKVLDSAPALGLDEMTDLFTSMADAVEAAVAAEREALETLRSLVT
ncbi:MAG TPA: BtrH N-terminal domain-containing protein [Acidimicrobiia bacterium]